MASKRLAKSMVDWAAFVERVPGNQKEAFRALKAKNEAFVARVHKHPEALGKIDFAFYRSRVTMPGMVDQFEKAYQGLTVPFPKDAKNIKAEIDADEKQAQIQSQAFINEMQEEIKASQLLLANINLVPPYDELTGQVYDDFFPDQAPNPVERPTFWPHIQKEEPENDPNVIN